MRIPISILFLKVFLPWYCDALQPETFGPKYPDQVTSDLISQLAVVAIKSRLKSEMSVECDVNFKAADIIQGKVGPVTVSGKGWQSYRGLTCRAIQATVEQCSLDAPKIISKRKLLLKTPALGKAFVSLNSADFGNFITHPLMQSPDSRGMSAVQFIKEGTRVDIEANSVTFYVSYEGAGWRCNLRRSTEASRALIDVVPTSGNDSGSSTSQRESLSNILEGFFNEMVFELDGTFLSFRDMKITDKGAAPSVLLSLNIKVKRFPSPGIDF